MMSIKPAGSRGLVTALKTLKIDVDYVETKTFGHALPADVAEERYQKMRGRSRSLYPAWVTLQSNRPDVQFNRNDWIQLWQQTDPGAETRVVFKRVPGKMIVYKNSAKIDAKREGNAIDLTLSNVDSMRLFLNDQMVDMDKPIAITINKKRTIMARARRSIEAMMNDQLFIGRGWRYFSAVLDVDLTDPATTRPTTGPATRPATRPATGPATRTK